MSIYIADRIKILNDKIKKGLSDLDIDALEAAENPLSQLRKSVRESIQAGMRESVAGLIKKLSHDRELEPKDIEMIEKWLVGDAQYYIDIENNFKDWVEECNRLNKLLQYYNSPDTLNDISNLFKLNAYLTDLEFTLKNVKRYVESKNRIKRFKESASSGIFTREDKKCLAELMEKQLYSEDF